MRNVSLEQAKALLAKLDSGMPEKFSVTAVAYRKATDTYYVKWTDDREKEIYDDGVAQMRTGGAKAAYSFQPSESYSALWFNESETDPSVMSPVAEIIDPKEVEKLAEESGQLVLLDQA